MECILVFINLREREHGWMTGRTGCKPSRWLAGGDGARRGAARLFLSPPATSPKWEVSKCVINATSWVTPSSAQPSPQLGQGWTQKMAPAATQWPLLPAHILLLLFVTLSLLPSLLHTCFLPLFLLLFLSSLPCPFNLS